LGESGQLLAELAGSGEWQTGQRFPSGVLQSEVQDWLESLYLFRQSGGINTDYKIKIIYGRKILLWNM